MDLSTSLGPATRRFGAYRDGTRTRRNSAASERKLCLRKGRDPQSLRLLRHREGSRPYRQLADPALRGTSSDHYRAIDQAFRLAPFFARCFDLGACVACEVAGCFDMVRG